MRVLRTGGGEEIKKKVKKYRKDSVMYYMNKQHN